MTNLQTGQRKKDQNNPEDEKEDETNSKSVTAECVVPVVTENFQTPILTIVLQVLNEKRQTFPETTIKHDFKEQEMTSAWRVVSFFLVVFVLPTLMISVPLYARYHMYHAREMAFTDGDMASLHGVASTFWCQGQRLNSNGSFKSYLTGDLRRIREKRPSRMRSNILLTADDITEWGFYLIKGSRITFSTCSRWPGGTLLVVQGEANLKRCFYAEERVKDELDENEEKRKHMMKTIITKEEIKYDKENGGEVFEDYDNDIENDINERLYSNKISEDGIPESSTSPNIENNLLDTPIKKKLPKYKNSKHGHLKNKRKELEKEKLKGRLTKRNINWNSLNQNNYLEGLLVDGGSVFFNINDTLDVTTGNSSFSSSEEFLRQCSNTIFSIDLTPFPDCSKRVSLPDNQLTWSVKANESDYYYFIFTSDNSIEANVISFNLDLDRRLYDVSESMQECSNSSECIFPFSFFRSEGVVVDFNEKTNYTSLDDLTSYEVTVICQPRSAVYTIFILLVPFIIIMFAFR